MELYVICVCVWRDASSTSQIYSSYRSSSILLYCSLLCDLLLCAQSNLLKLIFFSRFCSSSVKKKLLALSFTQTASQNAREMSWLRRRKKKQINCGASCVCLGRLTMGNSEAAALHSLRNYNTEFCHCFFFVVAVFVINSLSEEAHKMCAVRYSNEQQQR